MKAQETCTILPKVGISSFSDNKKSIGRVLFNIEYFFLKIPMTRSTCMRTFAMNDSCFLDLVGTQL